MIKTYTSFRELAEEMKEGGGDLHPNNCPYEPWYRGQLFQEMNDPCIDWQSGVRDFAEWLDHIGVKVRISDEAESFYDFISERNKK